ncbi:hypothetical protein [Planococcus faecalis]|uniref:Lipoprotein n=1 Tax=Planococcus faecalis TaxID=1598147 RepID=A0ABN4XUT5_9BACL|nr:hypothetical protein [Planococcus faecalis]AQU80855.1 hypothetical protein AJGP001_16850 [Planococcus faecalis]OHX55835.1 hypothetical protein BB777_01425 [Planococcus faecalis]
MRNPILLLVFFLVSLILISCNDDSIDQPTNDETLGNPNPEERLTENPDADIIMVGDLTYINAEEIDRDFYPELELGKKVLEIKTQTDDADDFVNGTASKLAVGTVIYEAASPNQGYIAVVNNKKRLYVIIAEG